MSTATQQPSSNNVAAIAKPPSKLATLKGWLEGDDFKNAIARALPKHMTAERFIRIAITATMRVPKLMDCTQGSIFNCLLLLSQYGLEPDGRRAHLIPFEVSKKRGDEWVKELECTLIIDFKGYAELVMRSGLVSNIHADVVCENDQFEYNMGRITKHIIDFKQPRGPAYAAYAVVNLKDGETKCEVISKDDIYAIRNRTQAWQAFSRPGSRVKQCPWNPAEPVIEYEMWKKTAFRRLTKWTPLSAEIRELEHYEDREEERFKSAIQTEGIIVSDSASKSDMIADMLDRKAITDDAGEMSGDELREQLEEAREASESQEPVLVTPAAGKRGGKKQQASLLAQGVYSAIASAKHEDDLASIGDDIRDGVSRGEISEADAEKLQESLGLKLETLRQ